MTTSTRPRLLRRLARLEALCDRVGDRIDEAREELAALDCPFKVGQRVMFTTGKHEPVECQVEQVCWTDQRGAQTWWLRLRKVMKDGRLSDNVLEDRLYDRVEAIP